MWDSTMINMIWWGLLQTLYMTLASTLISYVLGIPMGVILVACDKDGVKPLPIVHKIFDPADRGYPDHALHYRYHHRLQRDHCAAGYGGCAVYRAYGGILTP